MSYHIDRKKLCSDTENNTAVVSESSNNPCPYVQCRYGRTNQTLPLYSSSTDYSHYAQQ